MLLILEEWDTQKIMSLSFKRELICSFMVAGAIVRAFLSEDFFPRELMRTAQISNGIDVALSIFFTDSPSESKDSGSVTPLLNVEYRG